MSDPILPKKIKSKLKAILNVIYETAPLTLTALFFCLSINLIKTFESYTFSANTDQSAEDPETFSAALFNEETWEEKPEVPYITDTRRVAEYENILGIYNCFGELIGTFSTDLSVLPMADRKLLKEGLIFDSEGEMQDFLESLHS